jgi:DNA-binding MarR family transcriptional regulator
MITVTDLGRRTIEQAAPAHVETVRALVFDHLTRHEVEVLGRVSKKILDQLP